MIYPPFPNKWERALILEMVGKIIKIENQTIYTNKLSFKHAMKNLHDLKLVVWKQNNNGNEYKLTSFGEHIAEILQDFYEHST